MRKTGIFTALLALVLTACGGGEDAFQGGSGGGGTTPQPIGSLLVITSSPQIDLNGPGSVDISAFVRNTSNQLVTGVPVTFSANNNASLLVTQAVTDESGLARATLSSPGDPTARTITVTALAGNQTATVDVAVAGTTLEIQGPDGVTQGGSAYTYTVRLLAGAQPIAGRTIAITSARSNTLSPSSVTTNQQGQATFQFTAVNAGNDTLTAAGLGLSVAKTVNVNADNFSVVLPAVPVAPATATEVALTGTPPVGTQVVRVRWLVSGAPVVNRPVNFATTRGTVTPASAQTDANGYAETTVSASNAGIAVVTATSVPASGPSSSAEARLEFVAQTPFSLQVQPSVFAIGPGQTSTITAVVRDQSGNLVKNRAVTFTLDDVTGGQLSVGSAVTDSDGRARTVYTAGTTTSANEGVRITAQVAGVAPATVALTVARREVFISLGTGNEIEEPNTAQYKKEFVVQVTDSNGNGVANVPLTLRALSNVYRTGFWSPPVPPATSPPWAQTIVSSCRDEDRNRDGILDLVDEDDNDNGRLDAGNIVTVTPSNAVTDANGFVVVNVYYPQEYAYWLQISLSASTTVQGSEYERISTFVLPGAASDFNNAQVDPPGRFSPFNDIGATAPCISP